MKSIIEKILILTFICTVAGQLGKAQDVDSEKAVYRVTAFKKGNNQVISQSNTVEIVPPLSVYMPNAFTPDGDGLNDIFIPVGKGITEFTLQIFNRWGELIFESNDYKKGWDGTFKNEAVPIGAYIYKLTAKGNGSRHIEKNGSVTVVFNS